MKLLLGIVLYNPNEDEIEKVNKYQNYSMVKQVVIFDNSPESNENKIDNINRDYNWSGQNMGLAVPYNKIIEVAKQEERKPIILQHFTNHVLRHTFTTRACECQGVNIGFISDMLGHSDTQTTLNIYNDVQAALKKKTIEDLENKIIIG